MHITLNKKTLLPVVAQLKNVVDRKTTIPVLANLLFDATNEHLTITANNLELAMTTALSLESLDYDAGTITIPAEKLHSILRELPDAPVSLDVDDHRITLKCGKSRFTLSGLPKDDFPEIPVFESEKTLTLSQSLLNDMIQKTTFAVSHNESRFAICGVCVEFTESTMTFSATDGAKLSTISRTLKIPFQDPHSLIIPLKAITELRKLCTDDDAMTLSWNVGQIEFATETTHLVSRLIDAQFPNYKQIIPETSTAPILIDTESLSRALRRVMLLAPDSRLVKFALSGQTLTLSTVDPNLGEATETIEVGYDGEELEIGFNGQFVQDVLVVASGERVSLHLTDALSPGLWTSAEDNGWQAVVMPMHL